MVNANNVLPDPSDNVDENLSVNNGNIIMITDSDTDEEDIALDGYELLPVAPPDDLNESSDSDNDSGLDSGEQDQPDNNLPPIERIENTLIRELWSEPAPSNVDICMDSSKVDEVKQVMAGITLPASSIPEWATNIPEDQWKQHLIRRLEDLQKNS